MCVVLAVVWLRVCSHCVGAAIATYAAPRPTPAAPVPRSAKSAIVRNMVGFFNKVFLRRKPSQRAPAASEPAASSGGVGTPAGGGVGTPAGGRPGPPIHGVLEVDEDDLDGNTPPRHHDQDPVIDAAGEDESTGHTDDDEFGPHDDGHDDDDDDDGLPPPASGDVRRGRRDGRRDLNSTQEEVDALLANADDAATRAARRQQENRARLAARREELTAGGDAEDTAPRRAARDDGHDEGTGADSGEPAPHDGLVVDTGADSQVLDDSRAVRDSVDDLAVHDITGDGDEDDEGDEARARRERFRRADEIARRRAQDNDRDHDERPGTADTMGSELSAVSTLDGRSAARTPVAHNGVQPFRGGDRGRGRDRLGGTPMSHGTGTPASGFVSSVGDSEDFNSPAVGGGGRDGAPRGLHHDTPATRDSGVPSVSSFDDSTLQSLGDSQLSDSFAAGGHRPRTADR